MPGSTEVDPLRLSLLDAVLGHVADAVVEQDLHGAVQGWNAAAARTLGAAEAAVRGQPFGQFVDADHMKQWQAMLADGRRGVAARSPGILLRRRDGLALPAAMSLLPRRDETGALVGSCLVIQDHSERQLAQEALAAAEEMVRRSEALAAVGSFVLDAGDQSVQWSEGMFRIFGLTPDAFDGTLKAHLVIVHEGDRDAVAAALDEPLVEGSSTELDYRALVGDRLVWVFLAAEPLRDGAGRITGVRAVCQDITARKEAEESVRASLALAERANEELRALDALKDEFLATVSHELRTPLTAIIGFAGVLQKLAPQLDAYVEPIARGGAEMAQMVEKLLDYSRLQAGHVMLEPEVLELAREVERLLHAPTPMGKEQTLINDVPAELLVVTDANALDRVLGNLIGNARRYAGDGNTITVAATVEPDGSRLITVSDDGPGIPAVHQARLFERFFQVPGAGSRRGTGLGLALVREYVRRQGGAVWCESAEGEGSTFFVRLPPGPERGAP